MCEPLISVIIPVYNVEEYLDDCLKSVSGQTYDNLEIIVIDDGSTDSSGKICDFWERSDRRIHVIHKENGGLSDARNVGIQAANGDLIGFVDSDDVIHPQMYQKLYEVMMNTRSDITCCGIRRDSSFEKWNMNVYEKIQIREYTAEKGLEVIIKDEDVYVTVWNKLYVKRVIEGVFFELKKYHEDEFWSYQVLARAEKITMVDQCYYGYRQRENSIMNQRYSVRHLDLLDARAQRLEFIEKNFTGLVSLARCDLRFECIRAMQLSLLFFEGTDLIVSKHRIRAMVKLYPLRYKDYRILPYGRQVWCCLSNIFFLGICHIRNAFHFGP